MLTAIRRFASARPLATLLCAALLLGSLYTGARAITMSVDRILVSGAGIPALTSCGTTPAITGSDTAGIVTMGTSATGCVITFAVPYAVTPFCVVTWIATPLASQSYVTSTTAITLTQTSASNNKAQYICMGNGQ